MWHLGELRTRCSETHVTKKLTPRLKPYLMTQFEYLGPYKIGQLLGRGGMGSVYEAVHAKSGQRVAIKIIAQQLADEMRFRRRFEGEIETLRRLRHKGIVQYLGHGEEKDFLFYAMELVEGESLQNRIRREKKVDWQATIDISIQVCEALKHAHDIGAYHRDLKPANLIITADGTVKLVDFGIVKLFGFGEQTIAGSMLGTADYMAPEQADGGKTTPRTDLYSLGSVMYAMLTGRPPFVGKRMTEVIESLKRDRPVPLDMIDPTLPEALVELVHQLLEKKPDDRPPTALSVMKRLRAMRAGLQRELTRGNKTSLTESGPSTESPTESPTSADEGGATSLDRLATGLQSEQRTFAEKPNTVQSDRPVMRRASPDDATVASIDESPEPQTREASEFLVAESPKKPKTYFHTSDVTRERGALSGDSPDKLQGWIQTLSVVAMVAILAGGIGLFAWSVRTPPADTLYKRILDADREGDVLAERALIKQFVESYPQDQRHESIDELSAELDLEQYLRQLRTQANRSGGIERLEPGEQAFMDAMNLRDRDPQQAAQRLRHWIAVFQHRVGPSDLIHRPTIKFAQAEIARLEKAANEPQNTDHRVEDLVSRIQWSKDNLDEEQRQQFLRGMIELYRTKSWAAPVIEQAKNALSEL